MSNKQTSEKLPDVFGILERDLDITHPSAATGRPQKRQRMASLQPGAMDPAPLIPAPPLSTLSIHHNPSSGGGFVGLSEEASPCPSEPAKYDWRSIEVEAQPRATETNRSAARCANPLSSDISDRDPFSSRVYHDHATAPPPPESSLASRYDKTSRRGPSSTFPDTLHAILEHAEAHGNQGYHDIIRWQPHGRAFRLIDQKRFVSEVMPQFFRQTKFASFQRQLSIYSFCRLARKGSLDEGCYYHELFLRGMSHLVPQIQRASVKGSGLRQIANPDSEPDFYVMPPVGLNSSGNLTTSLAATNTMVSVMQALLHQAATNTQQSQVQTPAQALVAPPTASSILTLQNTQPVQSINLTLSTTSNSASTILPVPAPGNCDIPSIASFSVDYESVQDLKPAASPPVSILDTSMTPQQHRYKHDDDDDSSLASKAEMIVFLADVDLSDG